MRERKGIRESAAMEMAPVGVTTRARALAVATATSAPAKRWKAGTGGGELKLVQLRSRRRGAVFKQKNSVSPPRTSGNSKRRRSNVVDSRCSSEASSGSVPASCCSSNGSISVAKESLVNSVDLKEESVEFETSTYNINGRERRRETTPSSELRAESDNMDRSTAKTPSSELRAESDNVDQSTTKSTGDDNSSHRRSSPEKTPSKSEIEELFVDVNILQKEHLKDLKEKYNFDFEKEQPLEGPYEWVRLKP
ncbi:cyclin-dependent kinase inhibitor 1-like [Cornus florida]|uniref:cyclin-dependent kinase inhibitor 1-like n=1 Tax=Cornus florida TaxID=4283 RepID=UPI00289CD825|nr:cyclin-dependent kinase inhibitor 1-like [Cornus florida]